MSEKIPVNQWVRIHWPDGVVLAYTYVDPFAGFSAGGAIISLPPRPEELDLVRDRPNMRVRLSGFRSEVEVLSMEEEALFELPCKPRWVRGYEAESRPWRKDHTLAGVHDPEYPDDFEVLFLFPEYRVKEQMWVRATGIDDEIGGLYGKLLNTPNCPSELRAGAEVSFRSVPNQPRPIYTTAGMRSNLERWECRCTACHFDMHTDPLEKIFAAQFKSTPGIFVDQMPIVAFTTRCPMCHKTMLVGNKGHGLLDKFAASLAEDLSRNKEAVAKSIKPRGFGSWLRSLFKK